MTWPPSAQTEGARARLPCFRDASIGLPALQELATHDQWVMWRYKRIEVPGKPVHLTKIPVNANNGANAMTNEARTWASFKKAYEGATKRGLPGIGFVLNDTDGFSGLDLDKCISDDGVIEDWAAEIVALGETYCEISPSKKGLRFFIRGKVEHATKCDPARVELYGNKRFLTVTGDHVEGAPDEINPAPRTIQAVIARAEQFRGEAEKVVGEARAARVLEQEDEPPYITFFRKDREEDDAKRARGEYVGWLKNAPRNDNTAAGGNFFRNVNDKACAETNRWAQALFPQAKRSGTGWRVSSKSLGRSLEEDISITAEGIVDFGVADMGDANQGKRTPINLAMEWGGHADPASAARWLCEQMAVTPESLGWKDMASEATTPHPELVTVDGVTINAETGEIVEDAPPAGGDGQQQHGDEQQGHEQRQQQQGQAKGSKGPTVTINTIVAATLANKPVPQQEWLVEGLIPGRNVTLLSGDGGTGKSLLSLQLAAAVATGGSWIGYRPQVGRALFLSAEDEIEELHRRLARIEPKLERLTDLKLIDLAGEDAILASPQGKDRLVQPTALFTAVQHLVTVYQPTLFVLDTAADLFAGNENARTEVRTFISLLRGLCLKQGVTIVLLSHPSQTGLATGSGASGSTSWNNSVRSRLYFSRRIVDKVEDDPDLRVLEQMKSNRSRSGGQIVVRWKSGRFEREAESNLNARDAAAKAAQVFMALLSLLLSQDRTVSDKSGANYAPAVFAKHPDAEGVTKSQLAKAMERLFRDKRIAVETIGTPSRPQRKIVIAAQSAFHAGDDEDGETLEECEADDG